MADAHTSPTVPTPPADTHELLHRILSATESKRRGRLELALAIIMSLATLCSTWSGYQANQWGGTHSSKQAGADTAERQAAEDTLAGLQLRTFDALEVREYWTALRAKDTELSEMVFLHMRPELQAAVRASIDAGILKDPTLPGPFQRPEYALAVEASAKRLRAEAILLHSEAQVAGRYNGSYVLMTLMFASVLFFGGITGTFTARRVRIGLGWVALGLFVVTLGFLLQLPIHRG